MLICNIKDPFKPSLKELIKLFLSFLFLYSASSLQRDLIFKYFKINKYKNV